MTVISSPNFSVYYIKANGENLCTHAGICHANVTVAVKIMKDTLVDFKCNHVTLLNTTQLAIFHYLLNYPPAPEVL